jgi:acetyl-CoA carboxylase biotin carboxyl carrier protein
MDIDIEKIKQLAELAADKGLAELSVSDGTQTVTLKMPVPQSVSVQPMLPYSGFSGHPSAGFPAMPEPPSVSDPKHSGGSGSPAAPSATASAEGKESHVVTAPMVGTFYRSPSPDSPSFVEVGQRIQPGQTLCILEAMKQMNQLESEISGTIVAILLENGTPVEYGQPLFKVDLG